jgi:hypothetical protein
MLEDSQIGKRPGIRQSVALAEPYSRWMVLLLTNSTLSSILCAVPTILAILADMARVGARASR